MVCLTIDGAALTLAPDKKLLLHQLRTEEGLQHVPVVFNTAPTGSGKTLAALRCLRRLGPGESALLVAPTNALIDQHVEDARNFIQAEGLRMEVRKITGPSMDEELKNAGQSGQDIVLRKGRLLHRLLDTNQSQLAITNPDIFYAMLFAQYNPIDRRNLQTFVLSGFSLFILDEFHYYSTKQLFAFECFMLLLRQLRALDHGRRLVLLTATPNEEFLRTLTALDVPSIEIQGDDASNTALESTPFLSKLNFELLANDGGLEDYLKNGGVDRVRSWLEQGKDGVLISNSLARLNRAYQLLLRAGVPSLKMRRITGPVSAKERDDYQGRSLILATPTVDIGFNFSRLKKDRQNIDFVVAEAEIREQLLQRIGRAGRLLGKKECSWPAEAVVLVPKDAYSAMQGLEGAKLSRAELASKLQETMRGQATSPEYRATWGLLESCKIFMLLWRQATEDSRSRVIEIFEEARKIFAPKSKANFWYLKNKIEQAENAMEALSKKNNAPPTWIRDFLLKHGPRFLGITDISELGELGDEDQSKLLEAILSSPDRCADAKITWETELKERAMETLGLFAFRDSFSGPETPFWDPKGFLSESGSSVYNLLHVFQYYECQPLEGNRRKQFLKDLEPSLPAFEILQEREKPALLSLNLERPFETKEQFEKNLYRVRGIADLRFRMTPGPIPSQGQVDALFRAAVPAFVLPKDSAGSAIARAYLRWHGGRLYDLEVSFRDGRIGRYETVLGTSAYLLESERRGQWKGLSAKAEEEEELWIV